jgi:hypothetical protein
MTRSWIRRILLLVLIAWMASLASALEKPNVTYQVFQFPADCIPRIDGDVSDWDLVPESYVIGTDQLTDTSQQHSKPDPSTLDVRIRVGWVKGLNRLYFLYEAYDNYWDFSLPGLHNHTFEIVVDGDASGGALIDKEQEFWIPQHIGESASAPDDRISVDAAHWAIHGVQAQNYHMFPPLWEKTGRWLGVHQRASRNFLGPMRRLRLNSKQAKRGNSSWDFESLRSTTPGPKVRSARSSRC